MGLPSEPETLAALQARYSAALAHLYDAAVIRNAGTIRPGEVRANVFDWDDGLRLIISRERMLDGKVVIHVSASLEARSLLAAELRGILDRTGCSGEKLLGYFIVRVQARFRELSGDGRPLEHIGTTEGGIPHFILEES